MPKNRELTMLLVGDVFVRREDPPSVFQYVRDLLRGADFTFGNLEGRSRIAARHSQKRRPPSAGKLMRGRLRPCSPVSFTR